MESNEFSLTKSEIIQMLISVMAISFAFSIVLLGIGNIMEHPMELMIFLLLSLITIGSGFILHEMGHKIAATYYGAKAHFKMWTQGLIMMLAISLLGILFAAPGAVYIQKRDITKKQNGILSLAGPATNLIIMGIFAVMMIVLPANIHLNSLSEFNFFGIEYGTVNVWEFGMSINLILALFNLIPAFPLDGSKVFAWNKLAWVGATGFLLTIAIAFFPLSMVIGWLFLFVIAMIFSKLAFG
jgi:Zn-dependent protease